MNLYANHKSTAPQYKFLKIHNASSSSPTCILRKEWLYSNTMVRRRSYLHRISEVDSTVVSNSNSKTYAVGKWWILSEVVIGFINLLEKKTPGINSKRGNPNQEPKNHIRTTNLVFHKQDPFIKNRSKVLNFFWKHFKTFLTYAVTELGSLSPTQCGYHCIDGARLELTGAWKWFVAHLQHPMLAAEFSAGVRARWFGP